MSLKKNKDIKRDYTIAVWLNERIIRQQTQILMREEKWRLNESIIIIRVLCIAKLLYDFMFNNYYISKYFNFCKAYFGETLCTLSKIMIVRRSLLSICCQPSVKPVHYFTSIILSHIDWPAYTDTWYDIRQCLLK